MICTEVSINYDNFSCALSMLGRDGERGAGGAQRGAGGALHHQVWDAGECQGLLTAPVPHFIPPLYL